MMPFPSASGPKADIQDSSFVCLLVAPNGRAALS